MLLISAAILFVAALGAPAQDRYVPRPNEEVYGTWANE
jgi:hypothetical protein